MDDARFQILQLLDRWRRAWLDLDIDAMIGLFDPSLGGVVYLAEENPDCARGVDGVRGYWTHTKEKVLSAVVRWEIEEEPVLAFPADGVALAWFRVSTLLALQGLEPAIAGTLRVSMGMRRTDKGWRVLHYHESRHLFPRGELGDEYAFTTDIRLTSREAMK